MTWASVTDSDWEVTCLSSFLIASTPHPITKINKKVVTQVSLFRQDPFIYSTCRSSKCRCVSGPLCSPFSLHGPSPFPLANHLRTFHSTVQAAPRGLLLASAPGAHCPPALCPGSAPADLCWPTLGCTSLRCDSLRAGAVAEHGMALGGCLSEQAHLISQPGECKAGFVLHFISHFQSEMRRITPWKKSYDQPR